MDIIIKIFSLNFMCESFTIFVRLMHVQNFSFSAIYKITTDQP